MVLISKFTTNYCILKRVKFMVCKLWLNYVFKKGTLKKKMVTKCVYLNIVKWGWKFAVQSICHLLMTSRWLPPPPPPLQAEWLTSYRVCKLKFRNSPQSRGGSAITRCRRSVPARWLCQPACCQRLHKMSLSLERKAFACLSAHVQCTISERIQGMLQAVGEPVCCARERVVYHPRVG